MCVPVQLHSGFEFSLGFSFNYPELIHLFRHFVGNHVSKRSKHSLPALPLFKFLYKSQRPNDKSWICFWNGHLIRFQSPCDLRTSSRAAHVLACLHLWATTVLWIIDSSPWNWCICCAIFRYYFIYFLYFRTCSQLLDLMLHAATPQWACILNANDSSLGAGLPQPNRMKVKFRPIAARLPARASRASVNTYGCTRPTRLRWGAGDKLLPQCSAEVEHFDFAKKFTLGNGIMGGMEYKVVKLCYSSGVPSQKYACRASSRSEERRS